MAETVLKNAKVVIGSKDYSGRLNSVSLRYNADMLDRTVFGDNSRKRKAGLTDVEITGNGYWGSSDHDKAAYDNVGSTAQPFSISPNTSAGSVAYLGNNVVSNYVPGGTVGDLLAFDFAAVGAEQSPNLVRGKTLVNKTNTTGTAATNSSWVNIGTGSSTQNLVAAAHVTGINNSCTGFAMYANITMAASSAGASESTFLTLWSAGSPTTSVGSVWASTIAPTTKAWARVFWNTSGGASTDNPQVDWMVTIGIGG